MEAKFKIGETLIITDDPDESKRGKEVVVVDTFHFIRKSKVSESAVDLWEYKVKDETRIMGWISEYHLESLIKTKNKEVMNKSTNKYRHKWVDPFDAPFTYICSKCGKHKIKETMYTATYYDENMNPLGSKSPECVSKQPS